MILSSLQEAVRLHQLRHPHVVSFVGVALLPAEQKGVILMEFCEGRDLYTAIPLRVPALGGDGSLEGPRVFGWCVVAPAGDVCPRPGSGGSQGWAPSRGSACRARGSCCTCCYIPCRCGY